MEITPRQASEALQEAPTLDNPHDRRVHGIATAAAGVVFATYLVLHRLAGSTAWEDALTVAYVVALVGVAAWQTRVARTVPRNARLLGYAGLGVSLVAIMPVLGWINWLQHVGDPGALVTVAIASLVALPAVVAGLLIAAGSRR